jgi:hypothetical protein
MITIISITDSVKDYIWFEDVRFELMIANTQCKRRTKGAEIDTFFVDVKIESHSCSLHKLGIVTHDLLGAVFFPCASTDDMFVTCKALIEPKLYGQTFLFIFMRIFYEHIYHLRACFRIQSIFFSI